MKNFIKFNITKLDYVSNEVSFPLTININIEDVNQETDKVKGKEDKIKKTFFYKYTKDNVKLKISVQKTNLFIFSSIICQHEETLNISKALTNQTILLKNSSNVDIIKITYNISVDKEILKIQNDINDVSLLSNRLINITPKANNNDISYDRIDLISKKKLFASSLHNFSKPSERDTNLNKTNIDISLKPKDSEIKLIHNRLQNSNNVSVNNDDTSQKTICINSNSDYDNLDNIFNDIDITQLQEADKLSDEQANLQFKTMIKKIYNILKEEDKKNAKIKADIIQNDNSKNYN